MRKLVECKDRTPAAPAAGQFGILSDAKLRAYQPAGCPSIEQFEARFLIETDRGTPPGRSLS